MKLVTLRDPNPRNRDGKVAVVSSDGRRAVFPDPARCVSLLQALENWREAGPYLESLGELLNAGRVAEAFELDVEQCLAPLPRAPGFYDGSAFLSHVERARRARGDTMPESARLTPLMYQGVSDNLLGPYAPIDLIEESYGADFEGEFAVVTGDVPRATSAERVGRHLILLLLFNDITYRELLKTEIVTKFGFLQSKPNSAFAPFAVTPDEIGEAWKEGRIHRSVSVRLNGEVFGAPDGGEMSFSFHQLVAHACRTRPLSAGSIVGSGTVSNSDASVGFACLTEKRYQEIAETGKASTPWLKAGDRVSMEVRLDGKSVFGLIDQRVV